MKTNLQKMQTLARSKRLLMTLTPTHIKESLDGRPLRVIAKDLGISISFLQKKIEANNFKGINTENYLKRMHAFVADETPISEVAKFLQLTESSSQRILNYFKPLSQGQDRRELVIQLSKEYSPMEVASKLGVTKQRIYQIYKDLGIEIPKQKAKDKSK